MASYDKETLAELSCTFSILLLHDAGLQVSAEKINKLIKASKINIDAYWPSLFAKALESRDIGNLISNVGSAPASQPVAAAGQQAAPAAQTKKEEKKEEKPQEEAAEGLEGGIDLFGGDDW